jgi:glycosyltransferase involved in cell wall biosynthesis
MSKKNILEFCLSPDLGGLELFMVNCYENFKEKTNCKVVVAEGKKLDGHIDDEHKIHLKRNKFFPLVPALKLAKIIDEHEIDMIHFHWTKDIATVVLGKLLSRRKPQIMQTRNMTMTRFKDDVYHKWLYKNVDIMHAVTYQVKEQLEKFIPQEVRPRIEMVYMGTEELNIDPNRVEELSAKYDLAESFVVGIVGRIEEGKGQYLVIEAMERLKEFDIKVLIVGHTMDEVYLSELKERVNSSGLEEKVIFTGFTREVDTFMQLFDINVLATPQETFGLVVIEAMMNKVCMIATNKGGPLEIIENGKDGLLFNRTSEDLAAKIKWLYKDRAYKERMSLAGYKTAKEKFESKEQLQKLFEVIHAE